MLFCSLPQLSGIARRACARIGAQSNRSLSIVGIVLAVVFIQFLMRRCFAFGNLLLQEQLPDEWISGALLASDAMLTLYCAGLVADTPRTAFIAWQVVLSVDSPGALQVSGRSFSHRRQPTLSTPCRIFEHDVSALEKTGRPRGESRRTVPIGCCMRTASR